MRSTPGSGSSPRAPSFAEPSRPPASRWVGPPPAAIRAMGDKAAARRLAASPRRPDPRRLRRPGPVGRGPAGGRRATIGYPILVKPAAGGGGKGMRVVRRPERPAGALAAARREAHGRLRRRPPDPRAARRRRAPRRDPGPVRRARSRRPPRRARLLDPAAAPEGPRGDTVAVRSRPPLRTRLGEAALTLARAVGYVNAAPASSCVDERGEPGFLEMNTRLQVEHPVTELVTGRDLVADQLRIAAGEPLGSRRRPTSDRRPRRRGPPLRRGRRGRVPAGDRAGSTALRWPAGDGIRVDAGVAGRKSGHRPVRPDARQGRSPGDPIGRRRWTGSGEPSMRRSCSGS